MSQRSANNVTADIFITLLAPLIWGSTYLVTTELLPDGRPLLASLLRALPAGIILLLITRHWLKGDWWWRATVLGALNIGAFFYFLFMSAYLLPGGVAALVANFQPVIVLVLARLLLDEQIGRRQWLACVVGIAGGGDAGAATGAGTEQPGDLLCDCGSRLHGHRHGADQTLGPS